MSRDRVLRGRGSVALVLLVLFGSRLAAQQGRDSERFVVATGLIKRGLHDEAAKQLQLFVQEQPGHDLAAEAWYRLGTCRIQLGKKDEAVAAFEKALAGKPMRLRAECRYQMGQTLKERERPADAAVQFGKLVEEEGREHYLAAAALYAHGECLRNLGKDEDALGAFRAAAEAEKDGSGTFGLPGMYQAGFALMRLARFDEAREAFGAAAERWPKHEARAECRYLEGDAALRAGQVDAAEKAFARARDLGGDFKDDAVMGLAWCKTRKDDPDGALALFSSVPREFPGSPLVARATLEAARLQHRKGRHSDAEAGLSKLLSLADVEPAIRGAALELRGLVLLDLRRPDEAAASLTAALGANPEPATAARLHYHVAEAAAEKGTWEEALAGYVAAQKGAADKALAGDALYGECVALHKLGRFADSFARAGAFLERDPGHRLAPMARFARAENAFALKRWEDADKAYAEVPADHELARKAAFKRAWCSYLAGSHAVAAQRFGAVAAGAEKDAIAEEALSMGALAALEAGSDDVALAAADVYRARFPSGAFLARTERVASRVLKKRGDLKGAAARLAKASAAEKSPERGAEDRLELAEVTFKAGDFAGAKAIYAELVDRNDKVGARALEGLAWCSFELREDERCVDRANAALAHPAAGDARAGLLELLSSVHHRGSRWPEAEAAATKFLAEFGGHPRASEVRYALGVAQARGGKLVEARATLEVLAKSKGVARPDRVFYELAWASKRSGDAKAANAAFAKVAETSKEEELADEANLHLGIGLLADQQVAPARERLAAVKGAKHRPAALYRIGFTWLDAKDPKQAFAAFEEIALLGPEQPLQQESLFLAGESLFLAGDHAGAAERFRRFLKSAPDHERSPTARLHFGQCAVLLAKPDEAAVALEEFLKRGGAKTEPADVVLAHLWLGKARVARKEHERAEEAFRKVTELSDAESAAEAQFLIGEARAARGDHEGAVDAFVKLSILYGHAAWVQKGLLAAGRCYEKLAQPAKARKFFQELVDRFPDAAPSAEAKERLKTLSGV